MSELANRTSLLGTRWYSF